MASFPRSLLACFLRIAVAAAVGSVNVMADGPTKSPAVAEPAEGAATAPTAEKPNETSKGKPLTIPGRVLDAQGHGVAKAQLWNRRTHAGTAMLVSALRCS